MILSHGKAISVKSWNRVYFMSVTYLRWQHYKYSQTQLEIATININCMSQLQPSCSAALSHTDVLPWRDEGSGKPCAVVKPYSIFAPIWTWTRAAGFTVRSSNHYAITAHNCSVIAMKADANVGRNEHRQVHHHHHHLFLKRLFVPR